MFVEWILGNLDNISLENCNVLEFSWLFQMQRSCPFQQKGYSEWKSDKVLAYVDNQSYVLIQLKQIQHVQAYNDPRDSSNIDIIVSILRRFSNERKETVKQALRDVLKDSLSFFIEVKNIV
jgi:hypothetical protein